jgi:hypothetical protein
VARLATPPDPGHDDDALAAEELAEFLADLRLLPGPTLLVGADQSGHQADIELGELAAGIGDRIKAKIEDAFSHRGELRHRLHQR